MLCVLVFLGHQVRACKRGRGLRGGRGSLALTYIKLGKRNVKERDIRAQKLPPAAVRAGRPPCCLAIGSGWSVGGPLRCRRRRPGLPTAASRARAGGRTCGPRGCECACVVGDDGRLLVCAAEGKQGSGDAARPNAFVRARLGLHEGGRGAGGGRQISWRAKADETGRGRRVVKWAVGGGS